MYKKISFDEAKNIMDTEENVIIFDVREEEEYITGHAAGAICFPVGSISAETAVQMIPDKNVSIIVYCRSGMRSYAAAKELISLGYENIFDIGGLNGWPFGMEW